MMRNFKISLFVSVSITNKYKKPHLCSLYLLLSKDAVYAGNQTTRKENRQFIVITYYYNYIYSLTKICTIHVRHYIIEGVKHVLLYYEII